MYKSKQQTVTLTAVSNVTGQLCVGSSFHQVHNTIWSNGFLLINTSYLCSLTALWHISKAAGYKYNFLHTKTNCASKLAAKLCKTCHTKGSVSSAWEIRLGHNHRTDVHDTGTKHDIAKKLSGCGETQKGGQTKLKAHSWLWAVAPKTILPIRAEIGIRWIWKVFWSDPLTLHGVDVWLRSTDLLLNVGQGVSESLADITWKVVQLIYMRWDQKTTRSDPILIQEFVWVLILIPVLIIRSIWQIHPQTDFI